MGLHIKTGDILELGGFKKLERGKAYLDAGRVLSLEFTGDNAVKATVIGGEKYTVTIKDGDKPEFHCPCYSFAHDGFCKHCVAAILAAEKGAAFETLNKTYVRRLANAVHRIGSSVKPNPGLEIGRMIDKSGAGVTGTIGAYTYRLTHAGLVFWGGGAAGKLLEKFDLLRVKQGYRIDGYYHFEGMGGNFRPVVLPEDMDLPEWKDDENSPVFGLDTFPDGLDAEIEPYIIHDRTAKSYFQKSLFLRELNGIGAFWHGCTDWQIKSILLEESDFDKALRAEKMPRRDFGKTPEFMLPRVAYSPDGSVEVAFYFYSNGFSTISGIYKLTDIHKPDGFVEFAGRECIIETGMIINP